MMMEEINPDERCCKVWSGLAPQAEKPVGTLAGPSLVFLLFFFFFFFRHSPLKFLRFPIQGFNLSLGFFLDGQDSLLFLENLRDSRDRDRMKSTAQRKLP